jgi:hypothetical protein
MLDVLSPDFRKNNPQKAAEMEEQDQTDAFTFKVNSGQATLSEIMAGLKRFPKTAPTVAEFFSHDTSDEQKANAHKALAALGEALSALTPPPEASSFDRAQAIRERGRVADTMQKIAPELPKPIFTDRDVSTIYKILFEPAQRADPDRRARVSAARKLAECLLVGHSMFPRIRSAVC